MLFADDTNLFITQTLLNREMNHVQVWFEDSQLTLNLKKTNYDLSPVDKNSKRIEDYPEWIWNKIKVNNPKFLGVMIDEHLT